MGIIKNGGVKTTDENNAYLVIDLIGKYNVVSIKESKSKTSGSRYLLKCSCKCSRDCVHIRAVRIYARIAPNTIEKFGNVSEDVRNERESADKISGSKRPRILNNEEEDCMIQKLIEGKDLRNNINRNPNENNKTIENRISVSQPVVSKISESPLNSTQKQTIPGEDEEMEVSSLSLNECFTKRKSLKMKMPLPNISGRKFVPLTYAQTNLGKLRNLVIKFYKL